MLSNTPDLFNVKEVFEIRATRGTGRQDTVNFHLKKGWVLLGIFTDPDSELIYVVGRLE